MKNVNSISIYGKLFTVNTLILKVAKQNCIKIVNEAYYYKKSMFSISLVRSQRS